MKMAISLAALVILLVAPGRCFALWMIAPVSKEGAKEMGMEVRSTTTAPNQVRVELEFKTEGKLKDFDPEGKFPDWSGVQLRIGDGNDSLLTAPLRANRGKPGRVLVGFSADRAQLDMINLRVMVPDSDGGTVYVLRVKDFVEPEKGR